MVSRSVPARGRIVGDLRNPAQAFGLIGLLAAADEWHVYGTALHLPPGSAYIWHRILKDFA
jgi:hypothetical protein